MYGMTPMGVFFTAIFPLVINGQALCQQPQFVPKLGDIHIHRTQAGVGLNAPMGKSFA